MPTSISGIDITLTNPSFSDMTSSDITFGSDFVTFAIEGSHSAGFSARVDLTTTHSSVPEPALPLLLSLGLVGFLVKSKLGK